MIARTIAFAAIAALATVSTPCLAATPIEVTRQFTLAPFDWSFDASYRHEEVILDRTLAIDSLATIRATDPTIAALDPATLLGTGEVRLSLDYVEDVRYTIDRLANGQSAAILRSVLGFVNYTDGTNDYAYNAGGSEIACRTPGGCFDKTGSLGTFNAPNVVTVTSRPLALQGLDTNSVTVALAATTFSPGQATFNSQASITGRLTYSFDAVDRASPAPEPATWLMLVLGNGLTGLMLRQRARAARGTEAGQRA